MSTARGHPNSSKASFDYCQKCFFDLVHFKRNIRRMPDDFLLTKNKGTLFSLKSREIYFLFQKNFLRTLAFSFSESASHYLHHRRNRESNTFKAKLIFGSFCQKGKMSRTHDLRLSIFYTSSNVKFLKRC